MAAHQQITREWWSARRVDFDLFVSQLVVQEAALGDPDAAARRLELLCNIPTLRATDAAVELAQELVRRVPLPERAALDALHIGVATENGMDYLLTWNCKHIANAVYQPRIGSICRGLGYEPPVLCTPEALLEV
jgi:PIN domain-containing protein